MEKLCSDWDMHSDELVKCVVNYLSENTNSFAKVSHTNEATFAFDRYISHRQNLIYHLVKD